MAVALTAAAVAPAAAGNWSVDLRNKTNLCVQIFVTRQILHLNKELAHVDLQPGASQHFAGSDVGSLRVDAGAAPIYNGKAECGNFHGSVHHYDYISNPGASELSFHIQDGKMIMRHGP